MCARVYLMQIRRTDVVIFVADTDVITNIGHDMLVLK